MKPLKAYNSVYGFSGLACIIWKGVYSDLWAEPQIGNATLVYLDDTFIACQSVQHTGAHLE